MFHLCVQVWYMIDTSADTGGSARTQAPTLKQFLTNAYSRNNSRTLR